MERTLIPVLAIAPGLVYRYQLWDPPYIPDPSRLYHSSQIPTARVNYTGLLSPGSRKALIKAINMLVAISLPKKAIAFKTGKEFTFRVNFVTLTLPAPQGDVSDLELKRGPLKAWLEYWREQTDGMSYVWRAERQGNGNLHFHITTDRYILYSDLRDTWNNRLIKYGFIAAFKSKHGHAHPNSTDVHAVAHIRNLAAYIAKYMSKQDKEAQAITGRVWDCSANLKTKQRCEIIADSNTDQLFSSLCRRYPDRTFTTEHCAGVRLTESQMTSALPSSWLQEYQKHLQSIRNPQGHEKKITGKMGEQS